jgi:hypothetical protein
MISTQILRCQYNTTSTEDKIFATLKSIIGQKTNFRHN